MYVHCSLHNLLKKWYTRASEHVSLFSDTHEDGSITDKGNLTQESKMGKTLTSDQQGQMREILEKFPKILSTEPGKTTLINHRRYTKDCAAIRQRPYCILFTY